MRLNSRIPILTLLMLAAIYLTLCDARAAEAAKEVAKAASKKLYSSKVFFDVMVGKAK